MYIINTIYVRSKIMKVLFINNDGGGFCDRIEIQQGCTVETFFKMNVTNREPRDYTIKVNRELCSADQVLNEGDRITIVPKKFDGGTV